MAAATSVEQKSGIRSVLRVRDLRVLFSALLISQTGSWAYSVALVTFVFERTHSLTDVGATSLARFVPALLLSAYGGVIAERFERVRLLISSDLAACAAQLGLVAVAASDRPGLARDRAGGAHARRCRSCTRRRPRRSCRSSPARRISPPRTRSTA